MLHIANEGTSETASNDRVNTCAIREVMRTRKNENSRKEPEWLCLTEAEREPNEWREEMDDL